MNSISFKKILKIQRVRLNNLAVLVLVNVFTAGVGFFTTITIANNLGSSRFGEFAYALAIGSVLATNVRFGMDRSLIRDLTHFPERFNETLVASLLVRGLLLFICLSGLLILVVLQINALKISWGMFLVIVATALGPFQLANVFDFWESQGRHAIYQCVERCLYFAMIWSLVLLAPERMGLDWIGFALLVAILVFLFIQYRFAWNRLKSTLTTISFATVARTALLLLGGNVWLWMAAVAALGLGALNQIVLKNVSGSSELGVYFASFQIVAVGLLFLKNIARIGKPILAKRTSPAAVAGKSNLRFLLWYLLVVLSATSIVALPVIVFPNFILQTIFTPEYAGGVWILRLLGVYLFVQAIATVFSQFIIYSRMDKGFFIANVFAGIVGVTSCFFLIPLYSGVGAAASVLIGAATGTLIKVFLSIYAHSSNQRKRNESIMCICMKEVP